MHRAMTAARKLEKLKTSSEGFLRFFVNNRNLNSITCFSGFDKSRCFCPDSMYRLSKRLRCKVEILSARLACKEKTLPYIV